MKKLLFVVILVSLSCLSSTKAQIRFYAQFRAIPFTEAATNNFNLLTGIKLDPNKEIVVGFGLVGTLSPKLLQGDLKFNKSSISLSFNYYINRKFYFNGELNYNLVRSVLTDLVEEDPIVGASKNLIKKFFFDYDVNITYVTFRRFHLSFGTGIADFAKLAKATSSDVFKGKFQLNVALSLKVYFFQIKV